MPATIIPDRAALRRGGCRACSMVPIAPISSGIWCRCLSKPLRGPYGIWNPPVWGGGVEAPDLIRNRERSDAPVDSEVSFLLFEQRGGARCLLVSYSAHPIVIGSQNLEFTGDYPGFLMQHLSALGDAEVIYLGGAVGSMGHRAPEGGGEFERAELMGKQLAERVHGALGSISLNDDRSETNVEVIGMPMALPPYQVRLNRALRFSKHLLPLLGVDHDAWLQGLRIGRRVMVGTPADFCGEISVALKREAAAKAIDLWVLSFNGDYVRVVTFSAKGGRGYFNLLPRSSPPPGP